MTPRELLARLKSSPRYEGQIEACQHLPARQASFASPAQPLTPALAALLRQRGIEQLYAHQAAALDCARAGEHFVVATGTASGKTLCFNLPVLEALTADRDARALYLFPTKALAQDQLGKLREWGLLAALRPAAYDGDTPLDERRIIRREARVVFTNPDMLHHGILPNQHLWASFLGRLRFVVVDEAHAYRGVFGSHVALVLRRLRRLGERFGRQPQFILASATLANPAQHAGRLTGLPMNAIEADGAPSGERTFVVWNPPLLSRRSGERRSANIEAAWLMAELTRAGVRHLAFVRARQTAELLLRYARADVAAEQPALAERLAAYRAGYTPTERRKLEQRLFRGDLLGVAATTALELGVDIGGLDAVVINGFPGTIASMRQQAGRAGRGLAPSLAVMVAGDNPLDQFLARHPRLLLERPVEQATIDPENVHILTRHLVCAAVEAPLEPEDARFFGERWRELAELLAEERFLLRHGERFMWDGVGHPAGEVNLRAAGGQPFRIADVSEGDRLLGTVDAAAALQVVYPGAHYLHQGESYLIEELDVEARLAKARPQALDYYTMPRVHSTVRVRETTELRALPGGAAVGLGTVTVTRQTIGYRKYQTGSERLLEIVDQEMPERSYETEAMWLAPGLAAAGLAGDLPEALHAVEHALTALAPLLAMCDRLDLEGVSHAHHPDLGGACVFLYDGYPGGVGIAARCFEDAPMLLARARELIADCDCEDGCPACLHSPRCSLNNEGLSKSGALCLLTALLTPSASATTAARSAGEAALTAAERPS